MLDALPVGTYQPAQLGNYFPQLSSADYDLKHHVTRQLKVIHVVQKRVVSDRYTTGKFSIKKAKAGILGNVFNSTFTNTFKILLSRFFHVFNVFKIFIFNVFLTYAT